MLIETSCYLNGNKTLSSFFIFLFFLIGKPHRFSIGHKHNASWSESKWQHSNNINWCAVISSWWTYVSRTTFSYLCFWSLWECSVSLEAGYCFSTIQFDIAVFLRYLQSHAGDPMGGQQFLIILLKPFLSFMPSYVTSLTLDHCHKDTSCSSWQRKGCSPASATNALNKILHCSLYPHFRSRKKRWMICLAPAEVQGRMVV